MQNNITELHVRIVSARNLKDTQTFGTQDPYCDVKLGSRKFKTKVHDNGGKTPVWNEKFVFQVYDPNMDQLLIVVKNKNFTESKLIGECRLQVSMFLHGNIVDQWFALNKGNERRGDINIRVQMVGSFVKSAAAQAPYAQTTTPQAQQPQAPCAQPTMPLPQAQQPQAPYAQASAPAYSAPNAAGGGGYPGVAAMAQQQHMQHQNALQQQIQQQKQQIYQQQQQLQAQAQAQQPRYIQPQQPQVQYVQAQPPQVVYTTPAPQPVIVQRTGYGYHQRGYGGGSVAAAGGLGLMGGLILGSALGDDGGFDFGCRRGWRGDDGWGDDGGWRGDDGWGDDGGFFD